MAQVCDFTDNIEIWNSGRQKNHYYIKLLWYKSDTCIIKFHSNILKMVWSFQTNADVQFKYSMWKFK